jgi:hypothetical protein
MATVQAQHAWEDKGTWDTASTLSDTLAIHMTLLPASTPEGCKVLIFNRSLGSEGSEDPPFRVRTMSSSGAYNYDIYTNVTFNTGSGMDYHELFCAGHAFTADGRLFLAGGHRHVGTEGDNHGIVHTYLFDPATSVFTRKSDMWQGRWYPTVLPLPDRQMLIVGGTFDGGEANFNPSLWIGAIPESGNPDHQAKLPYQATTAFYPHLFIDPKTGRPFYTPHGYYSTDEQTFFDGTNLIYDPVTSTWSASGVPQFAPGTNVERTYPSAIMVDGVIVKSGGAKYLDPPPSGPVPAVKRTLFTDLNASTPTWVVGPEMNAGRMNHTLVGLPDGKVVAFNGSNDSQWDDGDQAEINARVQPEMFDTKADPAQGWIKLALPELLADRIPRGYHSTALLTPDGTVLVGGGEPYATDEPNNNRLKRQIFSPPYAGTNNWKTTRPSITAAPSQIRYGEPFTVNCSLEQGRGVSRVTLISLGSTTHAFNQNQTINTLPHVTSYVHGEVETQSGSQVTWQTRHRYMPPGPYMLFVVDSTGRPSVAKIVTLLDAEGDRILAHAGGLTSGTYYFADAFPKQLSLGDNMYLGNGFLTFGTACAQLLTLTAPNANYNKFKVYVEHKASIPVNYEVKALNYDTLQYVTLGSSSVQAEKGAEYAAPDVAPPGRQPYIDPLTKEIKLQIAYSAGQSFSVWIDRAEVRAR